MVARSGVKLATSRTATFDLVEYCGKCDALVEIKLVRFCGGTKTVCCCCDTVLDMDFDEDDLERLDRQ